MENNKRLVVLEHLTLPDKGLRFITTNSENNTHGFNGELWYKEVLFTDSDEEAVAACNQTNNQMSYFGAAMSQLAMNLDRINESMAEELDWE